MWPLWSTVNHFVTDFSLAALKYNTTTTKSERATIQMNIENLPNKMSANDFIYWNARIQASNQPITMKMCSLTSRNITKDPHKREWKMIKNQLTAGMVRCALFSAVLLDKIIWIRLLDDSAINFQRLPCFRSLAQCLKTIENRLTIIEHHNKWMNMNLSVRSWQTTKRTSDPNESREKEKRNTKERKIITAANQQQKSKKRKQ